MFVVNYIQILYLCILKQPCSLKYIDSHGCELHSNLVSLHSETTATKCRQLWRKLWITFKSCIFAFWNNSWLFTNASSSVVNYIQILYLCILKQLYLYYRNLPVGCELHSNLVSLHSETTCNFGASWQSRLWITFKSCIFAFWNNSKIKNVKANCVVNYIQILYLCILKQHLHFNSFSNACCELHSNLVSLHSETTKFEI